MQRFYARLDDLLHDKLHAASQTAYQRLESELSGLGMVSSRRMGGLGVEAFRFTYAYLSDRLRDQLCRQIRDVMGDL